MGSGDSRLLPMNENIASLNEAEKVLSIDRNTEHFQGTEFLFEHHGKPFSRLSVTNKTLEAHESFPDILEPDPK